MPETYRETPTITQLLERWNRGERSAAAELMPQVYRELRQIAARSFRRERADHTLQPTALVHEVYLKLIERTDVDWQNRLHFYGLAACMMRRALVDYSREKAYQKRGGGLRKLPLDDLEGYHRSRPRDLIALDDALNDLSRLDPQKALIVELRFFGGLTVDQVSECIGLSPRSVARQWRRARAVLYHQLNTKNRAAAATAGDGGAGSLPVA